MRKTRSMQADSETPVLPDTFLVQRRDGILRMSADVNLWPQPYGDGYREMVDDWLPGSSVQLEVCERSLLLTSFLWHPAGFSTFHFAVLYGGRESVEALLCGGPDSSSNPWSTVDIWAEDEEGLSSYDWAVAVDEGNNNSNKAAGSSEQRLQDLLIDYYYSHFGQRFPRKEAILRREKARVLYEKARRSVKEKEAMEWMDKLTMALLQHKWDAARSLAKQAHVIDHDPSIIMLRALKAALWTVFGAYNYIDYIVATGRKETDIMPHKIVAEDVLLTLLGSIMAKDRQHYDGIDIVSTPTTTYSDCLSLAVELGMQELAVRLVTASTHPLPHSGCLRIAMR